MGWDDLGEGEIVYYQCTQKQKCFGLAKRICLRTSSCPCVCVCVCVCVCLRVCVYVCVHPFCIKLPPFAGAPWSPLSLLCLSFLLLLLSSSSLLLHYHPVFTVLSFSFVSGSPCSVTIGIGDDI